MNESARREGRERFNQDDLEQVRRRCVFTTHTPVPAGQDKFPRELVDRVLRQPGIFEMPEVFFYEGVLNMTHLALNVSHFVNGVAKRHAETSQLMFASYKIDAITNGVHADTWTSRPFQELYDRHIPGWRTDNFSLRFAHDLDRDQIWLAHLKAKKSLFDAVQSAVGVELKTDVFTIGFARRATPYKRATLLLGDLPRLRGIAEKFGGLQIVYGGKAHPNDREGKALIQTIYQVKEQLRPTIDLVYLQNYDMALAKLFTSGVDLWLNTPEPPMEASGTSGMKAAINGVPSLSILDGWWVEGWIEGETGWAIGEKCDGENGSVDRARCDAESLYDKLEQVILPMFQNDRAAFIDVMRHSISLNGSFFNTQRMMQQYVVKAYLE